MNYSISWIEQIGNDYGKRIKKKRICKNGIVILDCKWDDENLHKKIRDAISETHKERFFLNGFALSFSKKYHKNKKRISLLDHLKNILIYQEDFMKETYSITEEYVEELKEIIKEMKEENKQEEEMYGFFELLL